MSNSKKKSCLFASVLCSLLSAASSETSRAAALTFFRSDAGVSGSDVRLISDHLDVSHPRWRTPLDSGHSTPIISGNRILLTTFRAENPELATVALDRETGKEVWKQTIPLKGVEPFHRINGSPAAATPASDGERLFAFFGSYGLICYDFDGHKIWERPLGPFQDEYGASSSPILVGDKLILSEDHDLNSFLLALNSRTGETLWKVPRPDAVRSYSTPAVWSNQGRQELLVAGALQLTSYDPDSGTPRWWVQGLARIVIPVPVPDHDMIYMASWTPGGDPGKRLALDPWPAALAKWDQNHDGKLSRSEINNPEVLDRFVRMDLDQSGDLDQHEWERHAEVFRRAQNAILALKPAGEGDLTDKALVWRYQRGVPYVSTPLVHNGIVWMVKDGGIVTKLNEANGTVLQEERLPGVGSYFASPITGDGKVYFASELGTVSILAESADWKLLSSQEFHEKIYATPVLDHQRTFVRTEKALYCF